MTTETTDFIRKHAEPVDPGVLHLAVLPTDDGHEIRLLRGGKPVDAFPVPGKSAYWANRVADVLSRGFAEQGVRVDTRMAREG